MTRELSHRGRKVVSPKIKDLIPSCQRRRQKEKKKNSPTIQPSGLFQLNQTNVCKPPHINILQLHLQTECDAQVLTCHHRRCDPIQNMAATFNWENKIYSRINIRGTHLSGHLIRLNRRTEETFTGPSRRLCVKATCFYTWLLVT